MNAEGRCICARFAIVSEAAALGAAEWIGRADGLVGELAARTAMADALAQGPVKVRVVASRGSGRSPAVLQPGDELGGDPGAWGGEAREAEGLTRRVGTRSCSPSKLSTLLPAEPRAHWR